MAPSVIYGKDNILNEDFMKPSEHRPGNRQIKLASSLEDSEFFKSFTVNINEPPLGDGSFSICRKCKEISSGKEFAVKILSKKYV